MDEPGLLARVVAAGPDPGHMLDLALGLLVEAAGAERGVLVLLEDGAAAEVVARNIRDAELNGPEFAFSRRIVDEVVRSGASVVVEDAARDPRFRDAESVAGQAIRSALAVPVGAPAFSVLYLDERSAASRFGPTERALTERLAAELLPGLRLVSERRHLERCVAGLRAREGQGPRVAEDLVGESEPVRRLRREVALAARWTLPVLLEGESGTGKALLARAIHQASSRRDGPFVGESCAALPDELLASELFGHVRGAFSGAAAERTGLLEASSGGTLFLDQAEAMSPALQGMLLRVLEDGLVRPLGAEETRRVDLRLVVASSEPLRALVQAGRFREDLLYRLSVLVLRVPPLRERREDVPLLLEHFARRGGREVGREPLRFSEGALELLAGHRWPGNVRELENEVRRLTALGVRRALPRHLSAEVLSGGRRAARSGALPLELRRMLDAGLTLEAVLADKERELIEQALAASGGTVSGAARLLGMERTKLLRRARRHGLRASGEEA